MNQEEKILEFDKIKLRWQEYAVTERAREKISETKPVLSRRELDVLLRETEQSRQLLEKCGTPPLAALSGMEENLGIASKGDCLSAFQLEQVKDALVAVRRMSDYLERGKAYSISLAYYADNLDVLEALREEIEQAVCGGEIVDRASARLLDIRREAMRCGEKMREKAEQTMRSQKEYMSDHFSTFREGHICVPVKKEFKYKVSGRVIGQSSTGSTLFMEPAACASYYEEHQQLQIEEEDEIRRILYTLTALTDSYAEQLLLNIRTMEKLDFAFSKGKLSLAQGAVAPVILSEREIHLRDARHPLLDSASCVPLQFDLAGGVRGIVITGPNTGGKTVALKTVALCCMMAQCGLHVPCKEARLCMNSSYLCDIGDGQNLSENLSTFSAHIKNVLDILRRVSAESLVILDELGSGTDPQEGMGLAIAVLEELKKSGCLFLATTHYPEIKAYAGREAGILNARMAFDAENLKPLYQMVLGEAGESCALYIAKRLGMPERMLRRAKEAAYGAGQSDGKEAEDGRETAFSKLPCAHLEKEKAVKKKKEIPFARGDSVMVYPDKKIGIVCGKANDRGALQVQLPGKKIWISHKRVKLIVAASELYPEDYDFSIVFDTAANRKLRHDMERKYVEGAVIQEEE